MKNGLDMGGDVSSENTAGDHHHHHRRRHQQPLRHICMYVQYVTTLSH